MGAMKETYMHGRVALNDFELVMKFRLEWILCTVELGCELCK